MRAFVLAASLVAVLSATNAGAVDPMMSPGLYQIEVRISLPNVQDTAAPLVLNRCIATADIESGHAFFVLSENPLKTCDLVDYAATAYTAVYRIVCPGPNRGSAVGTFETSGTAYHGTIKMNMGGKNMTMSETQVGKKVGECEERRD